MKKKIAVLMALLLLILSQSTVMASNYAGNLADITDNESLSYFGNTVRYSSKDGEEYYYEIEAGVGKNIVTQKTLDGVVVEIYIYDKLNDNIKMIKSNVEIDNISYESMVVGENSESLLSNNHPPRYSNLRFSLSDLCTAVGVAISVATLIGLIIVAVGGGAIVSTTILKAILSEAASISLQIGGLVTNRGIDIKIESTYTKRCRGSECFWGYYAHSIYSYSVY